MTHRELLTLPEFTNRFQIEHVFGADAAYVSSDHAMTYPTHQDRLGLSFYSILLVRGGGITYRQDSTDYPLCAGDLIIVPPYKGIRVAVQTTDLKYSSLLLDTAYFDQFRPHISSPALTDIISSKSGGLRIYHLGPSRGADLADLLTQVGRSIQQPHIYKDDIVRSLIHVCMMYIDGLQYETHAEPRDYRHKEDLYKIFLHLARTHFRKERQLKFYADRMNITTTYLSRAVKEVTGSTVNEHLACMVYNEACKLLHDHERSIGEISYSLGFNDQSAFTSYFKQRSGMTPVSYRKKAAGNIQ